MTSFFNPISHHHKATASLTNLADYIGAVCAHSNIVGNKNEAH